MWRSRKARAVVVTVPRLVTVTSRTLTGLGLRTSTAFWVVR